MAAAGALLEPWRMIGVAVVGLGGIGRLHARNLAREVPGARLARVVDPITELAEATARDLDVSWSTSYDDALSDPDVAALVIAAPSPLHAELVERGSKAGRHVFCEKPLGLDADLAGRAAASARESGLRLQVGFQRRFDPDFLAAKERIDGGEVGSVRLLRITHRNRRPPHTGDLGPRLGSLFADMTVHDFDTARWLVGEVAEVTAFEAARTAVVVLRFENGALGVVDNTRSAVYGFDCSAEVIGSASTLRVGARQWPVDVERLTADGVVSDPPADHTRRHETAYRDELRHFVECVESGSEPAVGGDDAAAALRLASAAERCVA
jgi:predicted dehydrogenase